MKSLRNDIPNLSDNAHVRSKIYQEFDHAFFILPMKDIILQFFCYYNVTQNQKTNKIKYSCKE